MAIHWKKNGVEGVTLDSPPSEFSYVKLSNKKRKSGTNGNHPPDSPASNSNGSSIFEPDIDSIRAYVEFVKIRSNKQAKVIKILDDNDVLNPKILQSKNITREQMSCWGLTNGIIAQLKDNVSKYERHLAS